MMGAPLQICKAYKIATMQCVLYINMDSTHLMIAVSSVGALDSVVVFACRVLFGLTTYGLVALPVICRSA